MYFFFPRRSGDGTGAGIVLARSCVPVAAGVVAELAEHSCPQDRPQPGLAQIHPGVGMTIEQCLNSAARVAISVLRVASSAASERTVAA